MKTQCTSTEVVGACKWYPDEPLSPDDLLSGVLLSLLLNLLLNLFIFLDTFLLILVCLLALGVTFLLVIMWHYLHQDSAVIASASSPFQAAGRPRPLPGRPLPHKKPCSLR